MKFFFFLVFISTSLLSTDLFVDHDIHISICELDFRKTTPRLTIKTFLDDLQEAVGLEPGADLPEGYTSSDELISAYVYKSIKLVQGDQALSFEIMSIDASTDAVWINCELVGDIALSQISISNTFLTEIYDDQANLVKLITATGRRTKSMDGKATELVLELD